MNSVKMVAVFVENKPGQTARMTKILADADVSIRWVTIASSGGFGVMKFLVDKCDVAFQVFKQKGLMVSLVEVLVVEVSNKPGTLQSVAECLAKDKINLENCSGFVANNRAILLIELHDVAAGRESLRKNGLRLLDQDDLAKV